VIITRLSGGLGNSGWGAWRCANPHKIVIASERFTDPARGTSDLIPDCWLRL
jgi:hypothetical protein